MIAAIVLLEMFADKSKIAYPILLVVAGWRWVLFCQGGRSSLS
jgi:hypothetical protein